MSLHLRGCIDCAKDTPIS